MVISKLTSKVHKLPPVSLSFFWQDSGVRSVFLHRCILKWSIVPHWDKFGQPIALNKLIFFSQTPALES
jgi:hypothetical protein